jgi:hypothetical protein
VTSTNDQGQTPVQRALDLAQRSAARRIASVYCYGSNEYWGAAAEDNGPPVCSRCGRTPAELGAEMPVQRKRSTRLYNGMVPQHLKSDDDMTDANRQTLDLVRRKRDLLHRRIRAAERDANELHESSGGTLSLIPTSYGRPITWEQAHQAADWAYREMLDGYR